MEHGRTATTCLWLVLTSLLASWGSERALAQIDDADEAGSARETGHHDVGQPDLGPPDPPDPEPESSFPFPPNGCAAEVGGPWIDDLAATAVLDDLTIALSNQWVQCGVEEWGCHDAARVGAGGARSRT